MDKSCITFTRGSEWWLERVTMDGGQRYPERIRVGRLENPRVYVPELTCHAVVTDENPYGCECSECRQPDIDGWNYCPNCGARVVEE